MVKSSMTKMLIFDYRTSEEKFFNGKNYKNLDITFYKESLNEDFVNKIPQKLRDEVKIISVFINSTVDKKVIKGFKNLQLIATRSTGTNHIDLEECDKYDIVVANVKSYGARAVAQYTFGLMIALERKLFTATENMKSGQVNLQNYVGRNLNNLTLGVIGTGEIGIGVCKMANLIGMDILAFDIMPKYWLEQECKLTYVDIDTVIKKSDIITLHVPYKQENYHIFSANEFKMMKNNAFLINTSRGELVDIYALYTALINKEIQGCALDVVECEKICFETNHFLKNLSECSKNCLSRAYVVQKLMDLPDVIITPHIAYNTSDAIDEILKVTMERISTFLVAKK